MKCEILNRTIEVPDGFVKFMNLKRYYIALGNELSKSVSNDINYIEYGQLVNRSRIVSEEVCDWCCDIMRKAMTPSIEEILRELREFECYEVDFDLYCRKYLDLSRVEECGRSWAELMHDVELNELKKEGRRQARTESWRSAWVGGTLGGGIKGALKGALNAELMNLAGGALSGAYNKFVRSKSIKGMNDELERLFVFCEYELVSIVRDTVIDNAVSHAKCLNDYCDVGYIMDWPSLDEEKASALIGNLKDGKVPEKDKIKVIVDAVVSNPFNVNFYEWLYEYEVIARNEVDNLANYFCISLEGVKSKLKTEEAKREQKKVKLRNKERDRIRKKEEASRTQFGIIWDSREESIAALGKRECFYQGVIETVVRICGHDSKDFTIAKNLSLERREKVRQLYGMCDKEVLLAVFDTTMMSSLNCGLIVTTFGLRWKNKDPLLSQVLCLSWDKFSRTVKLSEGAGEDFVFTNKAIWNLDYAWARRDIIRNVLTTIRKYYRDATFDKNDIDDLGMKTGEYKDFVGRLIVEAVSELKNDDFYCKDLIPGTKLENAIAAMNVAVGENIYALIDTTFFGSAKTGMVITDYGIRWKNDWATDSKRDSYSWKELESVIKSACVSNSELQLADDAVFATAGGGVSPETLVNVLKTIVSRFEKER